MDIFSHETAPNLWSTQIHGMMKCYHNAHR